MAETPGPADPGASQRDPGPGWRIPASPSHPLAARPRRTTVCAHPPPVRVRAIAPLSPGTRAPHSPVTRAPGWRKGPRRAAARRAGGRSRRASAREGAERASGGRPVPGRTSGRDSDAAAGGWSDGRRQGDADRASCDAPAAEPGQRPGARGPGDVQPRAGRGAAGGRVLLPLGPPGRAVP